MNPGNILSNKTVVRSSYILNDRDEATDELNVPYKGLDFTTDALRHSKVKLTWDEDDPERIQITRRTLSRKELEENDFKAYIASSSDSESEAESSNNKKKANRDKLRSLLLSGGDDALPEGWGDKGERDDDGMDMEITFTPGLSGAVESKDETTLEKYQRKMREKKKKRKEEIKEKEEEEKKPKKLNDEFFGGDSSEEEEEADDESDAGPSSKRKGKKQDSKKSTSKRVESTAEELALLAASDNPAGEVKHFNMKLSSRQRSSRGGTRRGRRRNSSRRTNFRKTFRLTFRTIDSRRFMRIIRLLLIPLILGSKRRRECPPFLENVRRGSSINIRKVENVPRPGKVKQTLRPVSRVWSRASRGRVLLLINLGLVKGESYDSLPIAIA
ncbi:hypothetical protein QCA50_001927 [Cerrena zonata]|uniref:NUC153 domain-containing protein n=1 Tax=Cerrena zonata TaxID=2478898 RepID=A0AAW0GSF5_9APHY